MSDRRLSALLNLTLASLVLVSMPSLAATQILHRGNGAEPTSLDPQKAIGVNSSNILRDMLEGLVAEAPDGQIVPGAASSWTISADGRLYTFKIRESARWSNGDPVTADHFLFSLRRAVDPTTAFAYANLLSIIVNADAVITGQLPPEQLGVQAPDPATLLIQLRAPAPYFLTLLCHSVTLPVHPGALARHGDRLARPGNMLSNGAYRLTDWVAQSHVTLERNPEYWDDANTALDTIVYHATEDPSSELSRYRAGEIDWTYAVPLTQIDWIRKQFGSELQVHTYLGTYFLGLNVTRPPFANNRELRRALSLAIDREIITDKLTQLGEVPAYSWVPPGTMAYDAQMPDYAHWTRERRHEEARRLYARAGYGPDNPLRFELRYSTSPNDKKIAIAVAAMLKQSLGARVNLINQEWKVFLQTTTQRRITQMFRYGWIGDYNDAFTFAELLHSGYGLNAMGYRNAEYDQLIDRAAIESDPRLRQRQLQAAERLMLDDQPMIPIYHYVSRRLVKPYVTGYKANILDRHYSKHLRLIER